MVYTSNCSNYKYIIHIENKTKKTLENIGIRKDNIIIGDNQYIIVKCDVGTLFRIYIDNCYMSNKCYSNGNKKVKPEFEINLTNTLSMLNKLDHGILKTLFATRGRPYKYSEILSLINEEPMLNI